MKQWLLSRLSEIKHRGKNGITDIHAVRCQRTAFRCVGNKASGNKRLQPFTVFYVKIRTEKRTVNPLVDSLSKADVEARIREAVPEINRQLPNYSRIRNVEFMPEDFERTPKRSIKRFLYQRSK